MVNLNNFSLNKIKNKKTGWFFKLVYQLAITTATHHNYFTVKLSKCLNKSPKSDHLNSNILGAEKPEGMATTTKLVTLALLWVLILFGTLAIIQVLFFFLISSYHSGTSALLFNVHGDQPE